MEGSWKCRVSAALDGAGAAPYDRFHGTTPKRRAAVDIAVIVGIVLVALVLLALGFVLYKSVKHIGPDEIGLVTKRVGKKLEGTTVIAMNGEAGYQHALLMPGWRFKLWPVFGITKFPWVQ